MGAVKDEFHEVIAGEYGAIEDLETVYRSAYAAHAALLERLPVYRSREQQSQLDAAYSALSAAKWKLDQARDWKAYESRNQHNQGELT